MKRIMTIAAALMMSGNLAFAGEAIEGNWKTASGETAVIGPCGGAFCVTLKTGKHAGKQIGKLACFQSPRRVPLRVYFPLHRSAGLEGTGPEISMIPRVNQCIVIQSRAARSASASSAFVMLRARSARSEAALSDPRIAAMLSHLWAAIRSTLQPRPVA